MKVVESAVDVLLLIFVFLPTSFAVFLVVDKMIVTKKVTR